MPLVTIAILWTMSFADRKAPEVLRGANRLRLASSSYRGAEADHAHGGRARSGYDVQRLTTRSKSWPIISRLRSVPKCNNALTSASAVSLRASPP